MKKTLHFAPDSFIVDNAVNGSGDAIDAGLPVPYGDGFLITLNDVADDGTFTGYGNIVHVLPAKSADEWVNGAVLYWDATNDELTDTEGSNTKIGRARAAKVSGETTAPVFVALPS